jgi:hypothetical protein
MTRTAAAAAGILLVLSRAATAHDGPPYPIASDRTAGPYRVSVWTDPDTTDDLSAGGQFWVRLEAASGGELPPTTRAVVTVRPLDRPGPEVKERATPVNGDVTNQFAGLVMDHEGRFAVHVTIAGPLGNGTVDGEVDATYDLRPAPFLIVVYLIPFVIVGVLWVRLVVRRNAHPNRFLTASTAAAAPPAPAEDADRRRSS